jgi:hypothetical protein
MWVGSFRMLGEVIARLSQTNRIFVVKYSWDVR